MKGAGCKGVQSPKKGFKVGSNETLKPANVFVANVTRHFWNAACNSSFRQQGMGCFAVMNFPAALSEGKARVKQTPSEYIYTDIDK